MLIFKPKALVNVTQGFGYFNQKRSTALIGYLVFHIDTKYRLLFLSVYL